MFTKSTVSQALIDATRAIMEEDNKKMLLEPELDETGFHKAAHAAKKANQSHFEFQGKKYPVTAKSHTEGMIPPEKIGGQVLKKKDDKAAATGKLADVREGSNVKIDTPTGTRVLGHRYGNAAKTHHDSMADPFALVKGPKQKDIDDMEKSKKAKNKRVEEEAHPDEKEDKALVKKMVKPSALKNEEKDDDSKYTTKSQVKKIADREAAKEVHKHEKHLHKGAKETKFDEAKTESEKEFMDRQHRLSSDAAEKWRKENPEKVAKLKRIPGYTAAMDLAKKTTTKEEVDLDEERHMTGSEKEKREKIVKSMKKGLAGFKDRYGNRAKNVMYATATKQAMKHEDIGGISTMSEADTDVRVDPEENMKSKTVDTLKGRTKVGADYHNKPLSYKLKLNVEEENVSEGKGTDVNPVFSTYESTPLSMAKDLAKKSFGKIRKETIGMAGHTSEEKKNGK